MAFGGDLVVRILADKAQFDAAIGSSRAGLSSFAAFAAKASVAIGAVFAASRSIEAADVQIQSEKKLEAVLKATGNAAGVTSAEIKKLAAERQSLTNFGDEATINMAALLATFKEIRGPIFRDAINLTQDMSAVLGTDLKGSAIQVGKALQDPIRGVTALRRAGVSFNEQQLEQIRLLQESGDLMGAQKIILDELRGEFGGAAEAVASPWQQLKNTLGDLSESIGTILMPAIEAINWIASKTVGLLSALVGDLREVYSTTATSAIRARPPVEDLADSAEEAKKGFEGLTQNADTLRNSLTQLGNTKLPDFFVPTAGSTGGVSVAGQARIELRKLIGSIDEMHDASRKAETELGSMYDALQLLSDPRLAQVPGVTGAVDRLRGLIDDRSGVTDAIKSAKEELERLQGRSEIDIEARKLRDAGASGAKATELIDLRSQIAKANQFNELKAEAEAIARATLTPFELFDEQVGRLEELAKAGLLDEQTIARAMDHAKTELEQAVGETSPIERGVAGLNQGLNLFSQQGAEAIAKALTGAGGRDPQEETRKETKKLRLSAENQERMLERIARATEKFEGVQVAERT